MVFLSLLAGCTNPKLFAANLPSLLFDGTVTRNVIFDHDAGQGLDIYQPKNANNAPVVVFFYGGRWTTGRKEDYAFVGTALAEQGFVVVIPDYRKYPAVKFPAFVEDGAKAVAWTKRNIARYQGQPEQIFVMGHSAGAHTGALLASDARYGVRDDIRGFAGLAGPYQFTPEEPDLQDMFGPPSKYPQMQVTTFINGKEPPMLLLWGEGDTTVGRFNHEKLASRIQATGGQVQVKTYPNVDHIQIIGAFTPFLRGKATVVKDVSAFFGRVQRDNLVPSGSRSPYPQP